MSEERILYSFHNLGTDSFSCSECWTKTVYDRPFICDGDSFTYETHMYGRNMQCKGCQKTVTLMPPENKDPVDTVRVNYEEMSREELLALITRLEQLLEEKN